MARITVRLLSIASDLQLVLILLATYPRFMSEELLVPITILNILVCISIHSTVLYGIVVFDSTLLPAIYNCIQSLGDAELVKWFIVGLVVHVIIIMNKILANTI